MAGKELDSYRQVTQRLNEMTHDWHIIEDSKRWRGYGPEHLRRLKISMVRPPALSPISMVPAKGVCMGKLFDIGMKDVVRQIKARNIINLTDEKKHSNCHGRLVKGTQPFEGHRFHLHL